MSVAKSLKHCIHFLRHLHRVTPVVGNQQRRGFRSDNSGKPPHPLHSWPAKRGEDAQEQANKLYGEEKGFDPRYDDRHYMNFYRDNDSSAKDADSRRRITQDTMDHQRRQERIIQDNKRRWLHRAEPKMNMPSQYSFDNPVFSAKGPRKSNKKEGDDKSAEDYSRRRRHQRQKEVKRQARELRESRKGYNLPKAEDMQSASEASAVTEASDSSDSSDLPDTKYVSRAWMDRQTREAEAEYWHTWTTCPDERRLRESASDEEAQEADEDDSAAGYKPSQRRGFVKPTLPYDSSVRRFQTHSQQSAVRPMPPSVAMSQYVQPHSESIAADAKSSVTAAAVVDDDDAAAAAAAAVASNPCTVARRRPSGMQKQYLLARDIHRQHASPKDEGDAKRTTSLLQSHVFKSPATVYAERLNAEQLEDIELPEQPRRSKLAWRGLPRPVFKRFNGVNQTVGARKVNAVARAQRQKTTKCVEPPRLLPVPCAMLSRKRTPIDSFSTMLAVNTHYTPHSEYTGYGRQTVCDAWQNFTNVHNLKPIY